MELLLMGVALWTVVSLGLVAAWIAVVYGTPRSLRPTHCPPIVLPQPRTEYLDVTDPATAEDIPVSR